MCVHGLAVDKALIGIELNRILGIPPDKKADGARLVAADILADFRQRLRQLLGATGLSLENGVECDYAALPLRRGLNFAPRPVKSGCRIVRRTTNRYG